MGGIPGVVAHLMRQILKVLAIQSRRWSSGYVSLVHITHVIHPFIFPSESVFATTVTARIQAVIEGKIRSVEIRSVVDDVDMTLQICFAREPLVITSTRFPKT